MNTLFSYLSPRGNHYLKALAIIFITSSEIFQLMFPALFDLICSQIVPLKRASLKCGMSVVRWLKKGLQAFNFYFCISWQAGAAPYTWSDSKDNMVAARAIS